MLSAEHLALQSRLVQQLVAVRQKEMDYMLARYQSIGTQAALICGFCISTLTSLNPSDGSVVGAVAHTFYVVSFLCILSLLHVILTTLFVCNWAPGLALRGPTGSMSRAFDATRGERTQVNVCFVFGLYCFGAQVCLAVWILDTKPGATPDSIVTTVLTVLSAFLSVAYLMRMHQRFFGTLLSKNFIGSKGRDDPQGNTVQNPQQVGNMQSGNIQAPQPSRSNGGRAGTTNDRNHAMPLLNNPVAIIDSHPDVSEQMRSDAGFVDAASEFEMQGYLSKQTQTRSESNRSAATSFIRSVGAAIVTEWREVCRQLSQLDP